jgi:hypothetical protein
LTFSCILSWCSKPLLQAALSFSLSKKLRRTKRPTGMVALSHRIIGSSVPFPLSQSIFSSQIRLRLSQPQSAAIMSATMSNETSQPTCQNCATSTTPLWRRDEIGSVLCNACGLFLKLHGRPRPISLKTDVIKSRNRVKSSGSGQGIKKKVSDRFMMHEI